MPAESGTRRQTYQYYDGSIDGKILKVNKGAVGLDGPTSEFSFKGARLSFKKDPLNQYSDTVYEVVPIIMVYYRYQVIGKFTGYWTIGSDNSYPFKSRKEYEVKLFNPTKTQLGDFTYYVNFTIEESNVIKNAANFTYSNDYVLMNDDGSVSSQVYKCHYDVANDSDYFPHHDPLYPASDCKKWDVYFGDLPWTGADCPMMYAIDSHTPDWDRPDLKEWNGYDYVQKRDLASFKRLSVEDWYNEDGDTTLAGGGQTSTTVNLGEARLPWLGGKIHNYGISMSSSPNPTKINDSVLDQLQFIVDNPEWRPTDGSLITKYFGRLFNGSPDGGTTYHGLTPNTTYYIRLWEDVWGNPANGEDPSLLYTKYASQYVFKTSSIITDPEIAIWDKVFGITPTSASFKPGIIQRGDGNIEFGVCYKEGTSTPTINDMTVIITGTELNNTVTMINCLPGRKYTFLPYAIRNKGQVSQEVFYCDPLKIGNYILPGSEKINEFTTTSGPKRIPKITLDKPTVTGAKSIDLAYKLIDNGNELIPEDQIGVCWSTSTNPTISDDNVQELIYRMEYEYKYARAENLIPGTKYYFRAYATNSAGTGYSDLIGEATTYQYRNGEDSFIVYGPIAGTTTKSGSAIMFDITFLNYPDTFEIGICYSKSQNPTISGSKVTTTATVGSKLISLSGLDDGSTYYYRAYYTDDSGTYYSQQMSFTTLKNIVRPVISSISSTLTESTVKISTNIISDGGATATNYIAYSETKSDLTAIKPVIAESLGSGTGLFESNPIELSDLSAGTWYYCSYSINEVGTTQSEIKSFVVEDVITESIPTLKTVVGSIKSNSVYWNTQIVSTGNSIVEYAAIEIKEVATGSVVYSNYNLDIPIDYSIATGLTPETEYELIFTVRNAYMISEGMEDVISIQTFTTLSVQEDPIASTKPNIKLSISSRSGAVITFGISTENVISNSIVRLLGKIGSVPPITISTTSSDMQVGLNSLSEQTKIATLPKPGIWYFVVVLFDPNGSTQYYSSNIIKIDTTITDTTDVNTGLPSYPVDGEERIIKGKRFIYRAIDNGWQRDYLYTQVNSPIIKDPTPVLQPQRSSLDSSRISAIEYQLESLSNQLDQLNIAAPSIEKNIRPIETIEQLDSLIEPGFYYATINEVYEPFGITDFGTFTLYVSEGVDIDYATQIAVFATDLVPRIYFRMLSAGSVGTDYMKGWIPLSDKSVLFNNENGIISNESIAYCVGQVTLTLPPATIKNRRIIVKSKNEDSADGIIAIVPGLETEFIDYLTSIELEPLGYIEIISDGEHWNVVSKSSTHSGGGVSFGDRVIVLTGNGDNAQKTTELLTAYSTAKTMSPTSSSPVTILLPPGDWGMYSTFTLDTEYINISSVTGRNDIWSNMSNWQITTDNISINGISWKGGRLRIHGSYPNVLIENCGGYIAGPSTGDPVNISSTFRNIDSTGYSTFSSDGIMELSGTFENIKCGSASFNLVNVGPLSGTFINISTTGSNVLSATQLSGTFKNCSGEYNMFLGDITGKMYDCVAIQGFSTISSGVVRRCILEGSGFTFPTPSAGGKVQLCIDSATV